MRTRYRYDAEMDCLVEIGGNSNYFEEPKPGSAAVISDDVGAGVNGLMNFPSGKMLDSKSRHRAENRARGAAEVGNDLNFASSKQRLPDQGAYGQMVKDAQEQIQSNWNGTSDWLQSLKGRQ